MLSYQWKQLDIGWWSVYSNLWCSWSQCTVTVVTLKWVPGLIPRLILYLFFCMVLLILPVNSRTSFMVQTSSLEQSDNCCGETELWLLGNGSLNRVRPDSISGFFPSCSGWRGWSADFLKGGWRGAGRPPCFKRNAKSRRWWKLVCFYSASRRGRNCLHQHLEQPWNQEYDLPLIPKTDYALWIFLCRGHTIRSRSCCCQHSQRRKVNAVLGTTHCVTPNEQRWRADRALFWTLESALPSLKDAGSTTRALSFLCS